MKEIIKLSFVLMLISAVAAGSLAYVNQLTSTVIAARERQEKTVLMQQLFPDVAGLDEKTVAGQTATRALDAAGKVVGVLTEGRTSGYGGEIRFSLALDGEGKVVSVGVISHAETPGIGDRIGQPAFLDQFIGKTTADPLTVGQDIDNITGATDSANAMADGVRRVLPEVVARFLTN